MTELPNDLRATKSKSGTLSSDAVAVQTLLRLCPETKSALESWESIASVLSEAQRVHALASSLSVCQIHAAPSAVLAALTFDIYKRCEERADSSPKTSIEFSELLKTDPHVLSLLKSVSRLESVEWDKLDETSAESVRAMFLALSKDVRAILIVLSRRMHTLRRVRHSGDIAGNQARRLAQETLDIYAPLTNRLGIGQWKWELEDHSLRVLEPLTYRKISDLLNEKRAQRESYVEMAVRDLEQLLEENQIGASVKGRPKHVYSIYKKMERKQVGFDEVYDIIALRVITHGVRDCYGVLGAVHTRWTPVPSEFDDYIAMPKGNGYQSLHTVVIGPLGKAVEIQIRTDEMDRLAELGVAAHWAYKENKSNAQAATDKFVLMRQLLDWDRDAEDSTQFAETLRTDLFEDQVYVFTPQGDIIALPQGATGLDFAYRVHTMVGHRCKGVRVNEQIVPLTRALRTGERVKVLTHNEPRPSRDWMHENNGFLRTASGRAKVRHWFRQQDRPTAVSEGMEIVQQELRRLDAEEITPAALAKKLGYPGAEELFAAVGYGDRSGTAIGTAALDFVRKKGATQTPLTLELPPTGETSKHPRKTSGIVLDRVEDVLGSRARCCNPVPGDAVLGFITRGRGMTIHRADCTNVSNSPEPERVVSINWETGNERYSVELELRAQRSPLILNEVMHFVANLGVEIGSTRTRDISADEVSLLLSARLRSAEQLTKVLADIERHPRITLVRRVGQVR